MSESERAEVLAAAAEEHAKHVVYYSTRYDGKGVVKWQDDGGLHCTCDWSVPPEGQGPRPWPRWHEHVVAAALDAALAAQGGDRPDYAATPRAAQEGPAEPVNLTGLVSSEPLPPPGAAAQEGDQGEAVREALDDCPTPAVCRHLLHHCNRQRVGCNGVAEVRDRRAPETGATTPPKEHHQ